jgi:hypothetical protein
MQAVRPVRSRRPKLRRMTSRLPMLVKVLNAALGLDLASFKEASEFLRSAEGDALLEAWLAAHLDDSENLNAPDVPADHGEAAPTEGDNSMTADGVPPRIVSDVPKSDRAA